MTILFVFYGLFALFLLLLKVLLEQNLSFFAIIVFTSYVWQTKYSTQQEIRLRTSNSSVSCRSHIGY